MNNFKSFTKFEDGITELCKLVPNVKEYIKDAKTEVDVVANLMDKVKGNYPSIYNAEYPATYSLSISAREVGFKTRSFVAFGWRVIIDEATNKVTYGFRISFNDRGRLTIKNKTEEVLVSNGWNSIPIIHKRPVRKEQHKDVKTAAPTVAAKE